MNCDYILGVLYGSLNDTCAPSNLGSNHDYRVLVVVDPLTHGMIVSEPAFPDSLLHMSLSADTALLVIYPGLCMFQHHVCKTRHQPCYDSRHANQLELTVHTTFDELRFPGVTFLIASDIMTDLLSSM